MHFNTQTIQRRQSKNSSGPKAWNSLKNNRLVFQNSNIDKIDFKVIVSYNFEPRPMKMSRDLK